MCCSRRCRELMWAPCCGAVSATKYTLACNTPPQLLCAPLPPTEDCLPPCPARALCRLVGCGLHSQTSTSAVPRLRLRVTCMRRGLLLWPL